MDTHGQDHYLLLQLFCRCFSLALALLLVLLLLAHYDD
jgi:hypothetical protein